MLYKIKNWDKFQQYKDDRPVHWIKLHCELIDDYHFEDLAETDQLYLIKLWLFAAKNRGEIEGSDAFIARKIGAKKLNMETLVQAGFVVRTLSYGDDEVSVPRGEERRGYKEEEKENSQTPKVVSPPYTSIVNLYHEKLPSLTRCVKVTETRKGYLKALWLDIDDNGLPTLDHWENFFGYIKQSEFLMGKAQSHNRNPFKANLEWITKPANYLKILEKQYHGQ